ncbi:MAG TPA: type II toxin-antitoxin system PemK/MazF family toxin [Verrucomicrobiota bacterium]|nr:type II toxin-antitoxin system PemK/MazF family toxin [Verrucomicrobiota bacterium]
MPKASRGELWMADLGFVAKTRPVLILSVEYQQEERAVVTYVVRTTSIRGTQYEVLHSLRGMPPGTFDAQGIASIPDLKLERRLGVVDAATLAKVEEAVRSWLAL